MKYCLLVVLSILFVSCAVNKAKHWDKASFDNKYSLNGINIIGRALHQPEPEEDTNMVTGISPSYHQSKIKTSNVNYFELAQSNKEHYIINNSKNNCRVYLPKSDTLVIRIGYDFINDGFGMGFIIHYKNGKFYTVPYMYHHIHTPNEPKPKYKTRIQELALDKEKYNVGDSIFGKIYFHITEKRDERMYRDGIKQKVEHYASGFFRAIVKKDLYW